MALIAHSVKDALLQVAEHQPDLVFLDIEMPPFGSGFDFLKKCGDYRFGVIFTTAYPKYAIQAINDIQPWAYLVKPFSVDDLKKATETAEEKINASNRSEEDMSQTAAIIIQDARKGNIVVPISDLLYCQADGAMADLYYMKKGAVVSLTASRTLKDLEEQLAQAAFCRCHHSYLVNMAFVERFLQTGRNGIAFLKNGIEIPISVSKMEFFSDQFFEYHRE